MTGNVQKSNIDHVNKNVEAINKFKQNKQLEHENKIRKSSINHETAYKLNEEIIEKKRDLNLGKISKWQEFRKRRARVIDKYLFRKKNQKMINTYLTSILMR